MARRLPSAAAVPHHRVTARPTLAAAPSTEQPCTSERRAAPRSVAPSDRPLDCLCQHEEKSVTRQIKHAKAYAAKKGWTSQAKRMGHQAPNGAG
jgi:hypothetical protein